MKKKVEYEIVYEKAYFGRVLYVLKVGDKFLPLYKSSGLAGDFSKGNVLPFTYIKTTEPLGFSDNVYGWISKRYRYNDKHNNYYSKTLASFPDKVTPILEQMTEEFASREIEDVDYRKMTQKEYEDYIAVVAKEVSSFLGDKFQHLFDFKKDTK